MQRCFRFSRVRRYEAVWSFEFRTYRLVPVGSWGIVCVCEGFRLESYSGSFQSLHIPLTPDPFYDSMLA